LNSTQIYPKGHADSDNQRPDKWISTVLRSLTKLLPARTVLTAFKVRRDTWPVSILNSHTHVERNIWV